MRTRADIDPSYPRRFGIRSAAILGQAWSGAQALHTVQQPSQRHHARPGPAPGDLHCQQVWPRPRPVTHWPVGHRVLRGTVSRLEPCAVKVARTVLSPSLSIQPSLARFFNEVEIFRGSVGHYICETSGRGSMSVFSALPGRSPAREPTGRDEGEVAISEGAERVSEGIVQTARKQGPCKQRANRDRPRFLEGQFRLRADVAFLGRPSRGPLPSAPANHGGNLPLEPGAPDDKTAVRAVAQALE